MADQFDLAILGSGSTACAEVHTQTEAKIADVTEKIEHLRAIKRELTRLARACVGEHRPHVCPVLRNLEGANGKVAAKGVNHEYQ